MLNNKKKANKKTNKPECDPVLLGLLCEALLPLLIQAPHLAVFVHVCFGLFSQREIWSPQVKTDAVLTGQNTGETVNPLICSGFNVEHLKPGLQLTVIYCVRARAPGTPAACP